MYIPHANRFQSGWCNEIFRIVYATLQISGCARHRLGIHLEREDELSVRFLSYSWPRCEGHGLRLPLRLKKDIDVLRLSLFPEEQRSYDGTGEFSAEERRMHELNRTTLWNEPGAFLFLMLNSGEFEKNKLQIVKYYAALKEIVNQSTEPKRFTGNICEDAPSVLKEMSHSSQFVNLPGPEIYKAPCQTPNALPALLSTLQENGDMYTFDYFHLRIAIDNIYPHNRNLSTKAAANREQRRVLLNALSAVKRFGPPKSSGAPLLYDESERKEWTKLLGLSIYQALPALGGQNE